MGVRHFREPRDIDDPSHRVGRGFQIEQVAAFGYLSLDLVMVCRVTLDGVDPEFRHVFIEDRTGSAVGVLDRYDTVAGFQKGKQG